MKLTEIKSFLLLFILLFALWLLLFGTAAVAVVVSGIFLSLAIALFTYKNSRATSEIRLNPKAIAFSVIYLLVFLKELVMSNLDVAFRVLSPRLPINPGVVRVRTRLKSDSGKLVLANSITLTPGTLTVDVMDENLYIHWIDVKGRDIEDYSRAIVAKFEKYLEVIYG